MSRPTLIVVSGPPGAGKTTLAHALAGGIGCPAICRDEIREGIVHAGTPDPEFRTSYRAFAETVTSLVQAGVTVVAESAFQDGLWRPLLTPLLPVAKVRILRCVVAPEVARTRIEARAADPIRAAHPGRPVPAGVWTPVALRVPTLTVDTADGWSPALPEVIAWLTGS